MLREDVVNPLRQRLYVRADRVMALRTLLDNLSDVSGLLDQEKDPEEFLNSLLNQVSRFKIAVIPDVRFLTGIIAVLGCIL